MTSIQVDNSISDAWVKHYFEFIKDETTQNHLRFEKPYKYMNYERQELQVHLNKLAEVLLPLVEIYPEIRNFLDMTTNKSHDITSWLERYSNLLPEWDADPKYLKRMAVSPVEDPVDWRENWKEIPPDHMDIFIEAYDSLIKIQQSFIPIYKANPHPATGIVVFALDLGKEYGQMLYMITDNFKNGRYRVELEKEHV